MKMRIDHSCGHTTSVDIIGPNTHGQRDRKAAWLANQPCPDCARTQREQRYAEQATQAAATAAAIQLPTLTGSDKQVSWAETLRTEAIDTMAQRLTARLDATTAKNACDYWTRAALRQTDAAWWIDNRERLLPAINSLILTADERQALAAITGATR